MVGFEGVAPTRVDGKALGRTESRASVSVRVHRISVEVYGIPSSKVPGNGEVRRIACIWRVCGQSPSRAVQGSHLVEMGWVGLPRKSHEVSDKKNGRDVLVGGKRVTVELNHGDSQRYR